MWLRALVQLLVKVLIGVMVGLLLAALLAALLAVVFGSRSQHAFASACQSLGVLALLMTAVGQGTAARTLETAGRVPGLPAALQSQPGDTSVSAAAVFFLVAAALIGVGLVLI